VVNAVLDALAPLGVTDLPMPLTPMRVWQALERARTGLAATHRSHRGLAGGGEAIQQP
jgi:carbon-monoxide dehydrogenase large subunit